MSIPLKKSWTGSLLLKNGFIVNGSGKKGFWGDILVKDGRIISINRGSSVSATGAFVLDLCRKKVISPGFIDMHSHSDMSAFHVPDMESKIAQGITAEVIGNCGLSPAPCSRKTVEHLEDVYYSKGRLEKWKRFRTYLKDLKDIRPGLNLLPLAGQGTIHSFYAGYRRVPFSVEFLKKIRKKAEESLRDGSWGISLGLIYPPGCFISSREMTAFFQVCKKYGGLVTAHIRDEGDCVEESVSELVDKACSVGAKLHISHLKVFGRNNWSKAAKICRLIRKARKNGVCLTADCYPYTASWTDLDTVLPDRVYEGGHGREIALLDNKDARKKVREEFFRDSAHREKSFFSSIMVSQARGRQNKVYEGKNLEEIGHMMKADPFDAMCDLLISARLMVTAVFFGMSEKNMEKFICDPYPVIGSDSSARSFHAGAGRPHPRAFGTFPRFFHKFVKSGKLSLEQGVRKCTGLTADILGWKTGGYLKEGNSADITIFDRYRIQDTATYLNPVCRPKGIEYVVINGRFSLFEGKTTKGRNGDVIVKNVL